MSKLVREGADLYINGTTMAATLKLCKKQKLSPQDARSLMLGWFAAKGGAR